MWKDLTRYNEITLVEMFRDKLNTGLIQKLVEIEKINEGLTLRGWYNKIVEFEKTKRMAENIFGKQIDKF